MKSLSEETHRTKYFQSVTAYQDFVKSHMAIANRYPMISDRRKRGGLFWFGRDDFTTARGAVDAMLTPTQRQLDMSQKQREELTQLVMPEPKVLRNHRRYSEDFGHIDIDRYLDGDSDFYRQRSRKVTRGNRVISLWINVSYPFNSHSDNLNWNAVTGIVLTDLLEAEGYSVELNMMSEMSRAYKSGVRDVFIACRVKSESDSLDMASTIGVISAVGFRFSFFTALASMGPSEVVKCHGYVCPLSDPANFVDCSHTDYFALPASINREQAVTNVKRILDRVETSHK